MLCCCSFSGDDGDLTEFGKVSAKGLADLPWLGWWTGEKEDIEFLLFSSISCDFLLLLSHTLSEF
jgi:hypothetical protein